MVLNNVEYSLDNFSKENTPPWLAKVGNICLVIGAAGALVALAPISPALAVTIGQWAAFAGALGKLISKTGGTVEPTKP